MDNDRVYTHDELKLKPTIGTPPSYLKHGYPFVIEVWSSRYNEYPYDSDSCESWEKARAFAKDWERKFDKRWYSIIIRTPNGIIVCRKMTGEDSAEL